jgi:hypothetical protein
MCAFIVGWKKRPYTCYMFDEMLKEGACVQITNVDLHGMTYSFMFQNVEPIVTWWK